MNVVNTPVRVTSTLAVAEAAARTAAPAKNLPGWSFSFFTAASVASCRKVFRE